MSYSTTQLRGLDGQIYYVKRKFDTQSNKAIESRVHTQSGNCIFQMQHENLPPLPEEEILSLALTNPKQAADRYKDESSSGTEIYARELMTHLQRYIRS